MLTENSFSLKGRRFHSSESIFQKWAKLNIHLLVFLLRVTEN